jgi:hypothetical protein
MVWVYKVNKFAGLEFIYFIYPIAPLPDDGEGGLGTAA